MDEIILVDDMEMNDNSPSVAMTTITCPRVAAVDCADERASRNHKNGNFTEVHDGDDDAKSQITNGNNDAIARKRESGGDAIANMIMMYSPDIPACNVREGGGRFDSRPSISSFYSLIETEETVKCVMSTTLFVLVLLAFLLIALLMNPEM